ncbi:MAG TPA: LysR family transcriptional regulator, partial [Gaiellaceae bacterium]|nr:LysR family transcriptional regulator [Gaiellaceae bacterium]
MDLRQLEHFVAVAEERHFTRAARRVHIVQSGLSASIRGLEEELGTPLLLRTTRRVDLTAAGRLLYTKAKDVLSAARETKEALASFTRLERGTLTIGTAHSLAAFVDLPAVLGRFHTAHPGVEIRLSQGGSASLLDRVRDGLEDVACVPLSGALPPGVRTQLIA